MKSIFTISLDFELHWGGFEKWPLEKYQEYFLATRKAIPQMLDLFKKYEVHVTWATVGILFAESEKELQAYIPTNKPSYRVPELSAYHYIQNVGIGENESTDPFHFAPSLINNILSIPYQEIGTHTFAHYYCNEEHQTVEEFRADIKSAQRIAKKYGKQLSSLVFPRNQFNDNYLKVCYEEGITAVRSNPLDWFWNIQSTQSESIWKRLNRGLDAYFPIGKNNTYGLRSISVREGFPICIPASRLLRPYRPQEIILNHLKIKRVTSEMSRAAKRNEVYHLWWHPHNFGYHTEQSLVALEKILKHLECCRQKWGMVSMNMGEMAETIIANNLNLGKILK